MLSQITQAATQHPQKLAFVAKDETLSYGALEARANALAAEMIQSAHATPIGYFGPVDAGMVIALLAAHKAGRPFVALTPDLPDQVLRDRAAFAEVTPVFCLAQTIPIAEKRLRLRCKAIPETGVPTTVLQHVSGDVISHIRFTSGSSGTPKAVALDRDHVAHMLPVFGHFLPPDPEEQIGLFGQFWPTVLLHGLSIGATLHSMDFADHSPATLQAWLEATGVTALYTYPQAARLVLNGCNFPALRYVHLSGDAVTGADLQQISSCLKPGAAVHNSFGASEFPWIAAHVHRVGAEIPDGPIPLGAPVLPDCVALISDTGTLCAPGDVGEITVTAPYLPDGYFKAPAESAVRFREWGGKRRYFTGDLAVQDTDGVLHFRGRAGDRVKIRGANVWLGEVEALLSTHPDITDCAVVASPGPGGDDQLVAYCVTRGGALPDVRAYLAPLAAAPMIPARFVPVPAIPRTASGKLNRAALPSIPVGHEPGSPRDAQGPEEAMIVDVWRAVLQQNKIDPGADFADLGGDSLLAAKVLDRLEQALGRPLPYDTVLQTPLTVETLADRLRALEQGMAVTLLRDGDRDQALYLAPIAGGHLNHHFEVLENLDLPHRVFGLRMHGLAPNDTPDATMPAIAERMLATIVAGPQRQPPLVMGYSFGALLAFEIATQAEARGTPLGAVILIDPPVEWAWRARVWQWLLRPLLRAHLATFADRVNHLFLKPKTDIAAAHLRAGLLFSPSALRSTQTLMITSRPARGRADRLAPWQPLLPPTVSVIPVEGGHMALIRPQGAATTASVISDWLAT